MKYHFTGDNVHEISNLVYEKNKKNTSKCRLLNVLPSMLSVKPPFLMLHNIPSFYPRHV